MQFWRIRAEIELTQMTSRLSKDTCDLGALGRPFPRAQPSTPISPLLNDRHGREPKLDYCGAILS